MVDIQGLTDPQRDTALANMELSQYVGRDVSPAQVERLYRQGEEQIAASLRSFGYYRAGVAGELSRDGDRLRVLYRVDRGEPVRIVRRDVRVEGPAADDKEVRSALERFQPANGEPLDHAAYEESKERVSAALRSSGYFEARLEQHRVTVRVETGSVEMDVVWQSGPRFHFGPVHFSEAQFQEEFLRRYIPWKEGEPYSEAQVIDMQQQLVDADYFSAVSVRPDVESAEGTAVPIEVLLAPAKRSVYSAGLHYSTDSGPGIDLGFERRWVNKRGHKLNTDLEYSQRSREIAAKYSIPLPGPNNRSYSFGASFGEEETATSRSRNTRLAAIESRRWRDFTRTLGLKTVTGDFDIGTAHGYSSLLYAEGTLSRKRADDLFFTRFGSSLAITLRLAPELGHVSDTTLAQLLAEAQWLHSNSDRDRFVLRAALGAMTVGEFSKLPPELRFFAGGDRSIRGFDYQQIGERDAAGNVIGGKYLAIASAGYERYFLPSWGGAVFVDGGDAFSESFNTNIGAGIGLRWRSPIGLVRLDVARPVVTNFEKGWRIHVVIGPDL